MTSLLLMIVRTSVETMRTVSDLIGLWMTRLILDVGFIQTLTNWKTTVTPMVLTNIPEENVQRVSNR